MIIPTITITAVEASEPGALPGWAVACECGTTLTTSLSERAARRLADEHADWHAVQRLNVT